jgi:glycerol-3-phosphate acyltransferase PlsY
MTIISLIFFLLISYLISSIPFGLVLSKFFAKTDIREFGSKNIGATNVTRILGKKLGILTLILDGMKGAIMIIFARFIFSDIANLHLYLVLICFVSVVGHIYPLYLKFKGGKGVATFIASIFALDFNVGFLVICFWILSFCLFRISAICSLIAVFSSIILSYHYDSPTSQIILCVILFLIILYRHKENIIRILTGEEKKI